MRIFFISFAFFFLLSAPFAFAAQSGINQLQNQPVVLEPLPGVTDSTQKLDFPSFLRGLFSTLLAAGAVLAVLMLVWGGLWYMVTGVAGSKEKARQKMLNAVLGLLLLFGSVLLLKTINPDLLRFDILIPAKVQRTP